MQNTYTIYTRGEEQKVQKLKTLKSYIKYRARIRAQAEIKYAKALWNDRANILAELRAEMRQDGLESQV